MRGFNGAPWPVAKRGIVRAIVAVAWLAAAVPAVLAQSDATPPGKVSDLALASDSLALPGGGGGVLQLHPMINTIGITVSQPPAAADHATLRYRVSGAPAWTNGHVAVLTNAGRIVGSLFWLAPATAYDVEVTLRAPDGTALEVDAASATTQADVPSSIAGRTLYVSASAVPGGDGSSASPFSTIRAGVNAAWPGDHVIVSSGTYHEWVSIPNSGTEGAYITVTGLPGATIDGGDPRIEAGSLTWTADRVHRGVYSAQLPHDLRYIAGLPADGMWRDNGFFYGFDTLNGLQTGVGHAGVPMAEGWFVDTAAEVVWVRSATLPSTHTWRVPGIPYGFYLRNVDWVWIEGFAVRYCYAGGYIQSSSHDVFHGMDLQTSVGIMVDSLAGRASVDNRIESCHFANAPITEWGYTAVKGSSMETGAIALNMAVGTIVRDNRIEEFHDGITGDVTSETDVYRNYIRHLSDDGLEPDGAGTNFRAWGNAIEDVLSSVSLAPINEGPVWIIGNRLSEFTGRAFKIGDGVSGIGFIYNNTAYCDLTGVGTQQVSDDTDHYVFRNNIFSTSAVAIRWTIPMPGIQMDDDNAWSRSTAAPYQWNNHIYLTLADLCASVGAECNGLQADPRLVDPAHGDFRLSAGSPDIDSAVWIPGISDTYAGNAPDRGCIEYGQPNLAW